MRRHITDHLFYDPKTETYQLTVPNLPGAGFHIFSISAEHIRTIALDERKAVQHAYDNFFEDLGPGKIITGTVPNRLREKRLNKLSKLTKYEIDNYYNYINDQERSDFRDLLKINETKFQIIDKTKQKEDEKVEEAATEKTGEEFMFKYTEEEIDAAVLKGRTAIEKETQSNKEDDYTGLVLGGALTIAMLALWGKSRKRIRQAKIETIPTQHKLTEELTI